MLSKVCPLSASTCCTSFRRYITCWDISFTKMLCSSSMRFSSITWSKTNLFNLKVAPFRLRKEIKKWTRQSYNNITYIILLQKYFPRLKEKTKLAIIYHLNASPMAGCSHLSDCTPTPRQSDLLPRWCCTARSDHEALSSAVPLSFVFSVLFGCYLQK